jgi:hypothetical protein
VPIFALLGGCNDSAPDDETNPVRAEKISRIVPASEALSRAYLPKLDLTKMDDAEIRKALGAGPRCEFRYTSYGKPVLALRDSGGESGRHAVIKLHDDLVLLQRDGSGRPALMAEGIRVTLTGPRSRQPPPKAAGRQEADLVLEAGDSLKAGYRGYYSCVE